MPVIPFAHQWTILENQLLLLKDSVNGYLCSTRVSNIPEFEYYMEIYPNGHNDERRGQTWISLQLTLKNVKKVEAVIIATNESANHSKTCNKIYEESTGWGCFGCKTNEFFDPEKKFIVDGKFTIKVNGIFKYETALPAAIGDGQQTWMGGELGDQLWVNNDLKDFTIITAPDGKEIKVDKFILRNRSEFFKEMLNACSKDSTLEITDFSFNVIETALKIIYDCNFTSKLSMDEVMQLLQFFDKYLLQELKAKVEPYLISKISDATVVRLTNCSIQTNSPKLKEKCMEFLSTSFASKTPLTDIDELDKYILLQTVKNAFHGTLETDQQS